MKLAVVFKPSVRFMRIGPLTYIIKKSGQPQSDYHTNKRSQKDESYNLHNNRTMNGLKAICHNSSTGKSANERM